jgi:hypothetical protein
MDIGPWPDLNLAGAIGTCTLATRITNVEAFLKVKPFSILWLASSGMADVVITGALSYNLRKVRRSDGCCCCW